MAPKKVVKKKAATSTMPSFDLGMGTSSSPAAAALQPRLPPYLRCRICNVSMPHLNFEWPAVPLSITISAIKQAIIKRHGGSIHDVQLWRDVVRAESRIKEEEQGMSLRGLGVKGLPSGDVDSLPVFTLHYDFHPVLLDDPIASITCQTRESNVDLKAYLQMQRNY